MTGSGLFLLNKVPVTAWVRGTARKMNETGARGKSDWDQFWLQTYRELGGASDESGSKGCPKAAAFGLWSLGLLREGERPLRSWSVTQINVELGKNAAYVGIAAELLGQGASPVADCLWPVVQSRYRELTGEEPAESEQGEIRMIVALFQEKQLVERISTA